jgi:LysR family glycine cleavage system transcriptional activator
VSRSSLPLNAIHAFLVTARHLNLTHAAGELFLTQGAVSRKIAALEQWLGVTLFDRHARGLRLTAQGSALLPELRQGFEMMVQASEKVRRTQVSIRLKAPSCAMRWLVPRLIALEQQRPELHVALTTTLDHAARLGNFDAAIVYGKPQPDGITLFSESLTPVMAAVQPAPDNPAALESMTFLHPTEDKRDWQRNQHFSTMDLAISAAIQGFGVAIADSNLVESDIASGRLIKPFAGEVKTGAVYSLLQRAPQDAPPFLAELVAWLCRDQKVTQSPLSTGLA